MNRFAKAQLTLFEEFAAAPPQYFPDALADTNERHLAAIAIELGARAISGWSSAEEQLTRRLPPVKPNQVAATRKHILAGRDPLGAAFCRIRQPDVRRSSGATYTPDSIIAAMMDWATHQAMPERIIDPGAGSARYLLHAAKRFKRATLIGIETDPLPALLARANLAVSGHAERSKIVLADFRDVTLPAIEGRSLFIGNPPYIRHHLIEPKWKDWLIREAANKKLSASQLAGLHVHFFLATALKAAPRDFGAFITAAEWLDVNYGSLVRDLFVGPLGGKRIVVIEPTAKPFPDAATTAAITYFEIGSKAKTIRLKRVNNLTELQNHNGNRVIRRERLESETRWSHLTRICPDIPAGYIELGELCRVHRGQVTGSNKVWIAGDHSAGLPASVLFPTVTKARELINAGKTLDDASKLRRVIDLPIDLDSIEGAERHAIDLFLKFAKQHGADQSYTAANRKAWWTVGLREPAPILATYMARRPPAFVRNRVDARHINIAHGLYPRETMSDAIMDCLIEYLGNAVQIGYGRTYAGGLTKFEPREMERLPIPEPSLLLQMGE